MHNKSTVHLRKAKKPQKVKKRLVFDEPQNFENYL